MIRKLFSSLCLALLSACTTVMYEGPARPDSEVTTIAGSDMIILEIDGRRVPYSGGNFATFKVLPGERTLTVQLNRVTGATTTSSKVQPTVGFDAKAGTSYFVRPEFAGSHQWRPVVVEGPTGRIVSYAKSN